MTIESLVHSNPTSPNNTNSGSRGRKLRKPSIDVYFPRGQGGGGLSPLVSTSTLRDAGPGGPSWMPIRGNNNNNNNNNNKRLREIDDVGRVDESKRMYSTS